MLLHPASPPTSVTDFCDLLLLDAPDTEGPVAERTHIVQPSQSTWSRDEVTSISLWRWNTWWWDWTHECLVVHFNHRQVDDTAQVEPCIMNLSRACQEPGAWWQRIVMPLRLLFGSRRSAASVEVFWPGPMGELEREGSSIISRIDFIPGTVQLWGVAYAVDLIEGGAPKYSSYEINCWSWSTATLFRFLSDHLDSVDQWATCPA